MTPIQVLTAKMLSSNVTGTVWNPTPNDDVIDQYVGACGDMNDYMRKNSDQPIELKPKDLPNDLLELCNKIENCSGQQNSLWYFIRDSATCVRFTRFLVNFEHGSPIHHPLGLYDSETDIICVATCREGYDLDVPSVLSTLIHECCHCRFSKEAKRAGVPFDVDLCLRNERLALIASYATFEVLQRVLPNYRQDALLNEMKSTIEDMNRKLTISDGDWLPTTKTERLVAKSLPQFICSHLNKKH